MSIIKVIIWGQAVLSLGIMAWLISLLGAEKRRTEVFVKVASDLRDKTGYTQSPLIDPDGFLQYLERYGFTNPTKPYEDEFTISGDEELNSFLNLSVDMARGNANMDTGILWMQMLDSMLDRLKPDNAPHRDGVGREVLGYVEGKPVYKGDKLYVDIRNTCATEWGKGQIVESSGNDGQGNMIIFEGGDYHSDKRLVWEPRT